MKVALGKSSLSTLSLATKSTSRFARSCAVPSRLAVLVDFKARLWELPTLTLLSSGNIAA
ncbi:MAG: hypothetical protein WKG01_22380 [Kofleriaceae bacterium]